MNKQDIIDAAMQIASGMGGDPLASPVIDADMTAEDLLPLAFRHAYRELLEQGGISVQDVQRAHTITVEQGDGDWNEGDLPDGILTDQLEHAFLPAFPFASQSRYLNDFKMQKYNNLLCYFAVDNGIFYTTCTLEASASGSEEGSGSGSEEGEDIVFHAPSIPAIPTNPATDIVMPQRALDAVINTLALAIRGEIKLVQ